MFPSTSNHAYFHVEPGGRLVAFNSVFSSCLPWRLDLISLGARQLRDLAIRFFSPHLVVILFSFFQA